MRTTKLTGALGSLVIIFGLPTLVSGACDPTAGMTAVQSDSGNGSYDCTLFTTSNGVQMNPVNNLFSLTPGAKLEIVDGKVNWEVPIGTDGLPAIDVDLISVARSSGKRCNYVYGKQTVKDDGLTTSDLGDATIVTVCSDGISDVVEAPPPEPISTVDNGCEADFSYNGTNGNQFDVAIGYTKQFEGTAQEGVALCVAGGQGQRQCVNECVPRDVSETECPPDASLVSLFPGELPLACAQCQYEYPDPAGSEKDLKYCWYWENRVCESDDLAPYCNPNSRTPNTFIPSPKKKSLNAQIDITTGSNCYTVTVGPLYGGYTYSYQYCP